MARYSISYLEGKELLAMRRAVYHGLETLIKSGALETFVPIRLASFTDTDTESIGFKFDFPEAFTQVEPGTDKPADFFMEFIDGVTPIVLAEMIVCEMTTHLLLRFGLSVLHHVGSEDSKQAVWWFRVEEGLNPRRQVILSMGRDEIEVSMRTHNCLENSNIGTVGELCSKTETELLRTKNFGRKSVNEIKELLAQFGLWLGMSEAEKLTFVPLGNWI